MSLNNEEIKSRALGVKMNKIKSSSLFYKFQRSLSVRVSIFLSDFVLFIKPNHISVLAVVLVILTLVLSLGSNYYNPYVIIIIQLILLFISSILDKVDGELARIQNNFSQKGIYLDILYHLYYVLVFYLVTGFFFFYIFEHEFYLIFSILLAVLMVSYKLTGKIRHHIRFKIILEDHKNDIIDFGRINFKKQPRPVRWFNYLIFMTYDWVWLFYLFLIFITYTNIYIAEVLYY